LRAESTSDETPLQGCFESLIVFFKNPTIWDVQNPDISMCRFLTFVKLYDKGVDKGVDKVHSDTRQGHQVKFMTD